MAHGSGVLAAFRVGDVTFVAMRVTVERGSPLAGRTVAEIEARGGRDRVSPVPVHPSHIRAGAIGGKREARHATGETTMADVTGDFYASDGWIGYGAEFQVGQLLREADRVERARRRELRDGAPRKAD